MEPRAVRLAAALALLAAACGGAGGGGSSFGLQERKIVQGLTFPTALPNPGSVDALNAFPALLFNAPVLITHAGDGSDRLFVVELAGRVQVFQNDSAVQTKREFLDISARVTTGGERGLLGLAFHPDYESNGFFYAHYSTTTSAPGMNHRAVVSRFEASPGDPDFADPSTETVLLQVEQPFANHNGGMIAFGPDGNLYIAIGDGGSADDPGDRGQDLTTLLGKILRLAPDGSIPADNPFVGQGGGVREEIWAYGLRNPWRFSFDRNTGDLWCGDVGQNRIEEIDLVRAGDDCGWDTFEGSLDHENPQGLPLSSTTPPVYEYDTSLGKSITGGYVYRGAANPSLVGAYVYADFVSGRVWALVYDGSQVVSNTEITSVFNPVSFGEDEAGELYVCDISGAVLRFEERSGGGGGGAFPQRLSETGLFEDTAGLVAAPGVLEYDVNAALWSDGARKRRWMALPGTASILFDPLGGWDFPLGTVLVKHFEIDTSPAEVRRLETRVLVHGACGWEGYTYKWNEAQTDADLLADADSDTFPVRLPSGDEIELTWRYPARPDCLSCHTAAADRVLGLRTRQINRDFDFPAARDNQLRAWNHVGLFSTDIGEPAAYGALPSPDDESAPLSRRARAYLAANCANCHRPGGPTPVDIDLRFGIPTADMNAVFVPPSAGELGLFEPLLIAPGSKESSVLWERMRRLDGTRMPPLGSTRRDSAALELIGNWIDSGAE